MSGQARTTLIAEAGVNHNGSLDRAKALVEAAARAGADAVKFQVFRAHALAAAGADKAPYQRTADRPAESQREMLAALELGPEAHEALADHCRAHGVAYLASAFDQASVALLADRLGVDRLKAGSGELTNAPLLLAMARTGKGILLSTGMATLADVEAALGVLAFGYLGAHEPPSQQAFAAAYASAQGRATLADKVVLLHCTSAYPAPAAEANLRAMDTLRAAFGLPVGYSDHTEGLAVGLAAVARGAAVLEKHFTLDKALPGPDHRLSLDPGEFAALTRGVRTVEAALGHGRKAPAPAEREVRDAVRRSIVAARDVRAGETLTADALAVKRPAGGLSPLQYWACLGRRAARDLRADERLMPWDLA